MAELKLYGFDGSTYVRTVKMLLAEKAFWDFDQDPVNVMKGEPHSAEHLQRHPFGKVPVIEHRGLRIYETAAIARYLNAVLPGRSLVPAAPKDAARMDMAVGIVDSYGYPAMLGGVAAYHLFPEFVGGKDENKHHEALKTSRTVLTELMRLRGEDPWIAGKDLSLADLYLAPVFAYVAMTPHAEEFDDVPGFADWWGAAQQLDSFRGSKPS